MVKDFLKLDKYAALTGVELLKAEPGYACAELRIDEKHLNAGGVCQGGVLFTLADLAFAAAANSGGKLTYSLNASIQFFRSCSQGVITAEAREIFTHNKIPCFEVVITDDKSSMIAKITMTGYRKDHSLGVF